MSKHIAILGGGVIGLSTALALLEDQRGGKTLVSVVAKEVPDLSGFDFAGAEKVEKRKHSAAYASVWAGGHHVSDAKSARELRHDKITFERMVKLIRERPWARSDSSQQHSSQVILPIPDKPGSSSRKVEPEPLVWVHQTESFEASEGSKLGPKAPYEGVLDWYPDVSKRLHLLTFDKTLR